MTFKIGNKFGALRKNTKHTEETKKKISIRTKMAMKKIPKNILSFWTGKKMSIETRKKMSNSRKGNKSWNWKGGISPENKRIRASIEYRLWREAVFSRDNWTCQDCGKRGVELHPHHIKQFAYYPELRFAIDNGKTLCIKCHLKKGLHKTS